VRGERMIDECHTCPREPDNSPGYCIDCYSRLEKRNIEMNNFLNKIYVIVEKWYLSDEDTAEDLMNEIKLILENGYKMRENQNE
jgi:hypothetical protein